MGDDHLAQAIEPGNGYQIGAGKPRMYGLRPAGKPKLNIATQ